MANKALTNLEVRSFASLFSGCSSFYVQNNLPKTSKRNGEKVKTQITTVKNDVTELVYKAHLTGVKGLGICPVDSVGNVMFSCIDIDVYNEKLLRAVIETIDSYHLPLIPMTSKSGGLHLYIFYKKKVKAKKSIELLNKIIGVFSWDKVFGDKIEVFPKSEKPGNCITLPYFNMGSLTGMVNKDFEEIDLYSFLSFILDKNGENKADINEVEKTLNSIPFEDAPPCLQKILVSPMVVQDNRNNTLFSLGVYFKNKYGEEGFSKHLYDFNDSLTDPLERSEMDVLVTSLVENTYYYKCKENPLKSLCDKKGCSLRDFGIGKDKGHFTGVEFGKFIKLETKEPTWRLEARPQGFEGDFTALHIPDTGKLLNQMFFIEQCVKTLHVAPVRVKDAVWFEEVNKLLRNVEVVEVVEEFDTTVVSLYKKTLYNYLTHKRTPTDKAYSLVVGMVYYKDGFSYFTTEGVEDYFKVKRVTIKDMQLAEMLTNFGVVESKVEYETNGVKQVLKCWAKKDDEELKSRRESLEFVIQAQVEEVESKFSDYTDNSKLDSSKLEF